MTTFELPDGPRLVRFTGTQLAHKTSDDGDRLRWLELNVYKTKAGKYIAYQIGRSVVYHLVDSSCTPRSFETVRLADLDPDNSEPCPVCNPDVAANDQVRSESDLHRVMIHPNAKALVESLENINAQGRRYHSRVVRDLLVEASDKDEGVHEAFLVTEVA